jgi:hypothetical protein
MTVCRDSDHPRGVDGKFVNSPKAGVDVSTRGGLIEAPVDAAGDDTEWERIAASSNLSPAMVSELRDDTGTPIAEVTDAITHRVPLDTYGWARRGGAGHSELIEAHNAGIDPMDYGTARHDGAGHSHILEVHAHGVSVSDYAEALHCGATHTEVLEAVDRQLDIYRYAKFREHIADHTAAMQRMETVLARPAR